MRSRASLLAVITVSSLSIAVAVLADETEPPTPPPTPRAEDQSAELPADDGVAAMRAYRDPATGEIRLGETVPVPVRSLSPRERNMLKRSDEGLQARALPNGTVAVNLQGRFQSMATIEVRKETSELHLGCSIDDHVLAPEPGH